MSFRIPRGVLAILSLAACASWVASTTAAETRTIARVHPAEEVIDSEGDEAPVVESFQHGKRPPTPAWQRPPRGHAEQVSYATRRTQQPGYGSRSVHRGTYVSQEIVEGDEGGPEYYEDGGEMVGPGAADGPGCATCGEGGCGIDDGRTCDSCGGCGDPCCELCHPRIFFNEFALMSGVQGFKGPIDQGLNGNFGFTEGLSTAGRISRCWCLGYQIGASALQSDLSGNNIEGNSNDTRSQLFVTGGIFHRSACGCGLQFGAVVDYLDDSFYVDYQLAQIRAEVSWVTYGGHELGFWGTFATNDDNVPIATVLTPIEATGMYNLFYRRTLENGGQGRVWIGVTNDSDAMVGADMRVPVSNRLDLTGEFNYLIPNEGRGLGAAQESWGLGMHLVFYPFRSPCGTHDSPFRALLPVADNTYFMVGPK